MIIAKTDKNLSLKEYQEWHNLYKSMIDNDFLMVDGKFTLYSIDNNVERIDDNGNQEGH